VEKINVSEGASFDAGRTREDRGKWEKNYHGTLKGNSTSSKPTFGRPKTANLGSLRGEVGVEADITTIRTSDKGGCGSGK